MGASRPGTERSAGGSPVLNTFVHVQVSWVHFVPQPAFEIQTNWPPVSQVFVFC